MDKSEIIRLIASDELNQAFDKLHDQFMAFQKTSSNKLDEEDYSGFIQISRRFHAIKKEKELGLVNLESSILEFNRVTHATLMLLDRLPEEFFSGKRPPEARETPAIEAEETPPGPEPEADPPAEESPPKKEKESPSKARPTARPSKVRETPATEAEKTPPGPEPEADPPAEESPGQTGKTEEKESPLTPKPKVKPTAKPTAKPSGRPAKAKRSGASRQKGKEEKVAEFRNVLYWKDWLGFKQYYGKFVVYRNRIVFEGKGGFLLEGQSQNLVFEKAAIDKVFMGSVALNIVTRDKKYQFPFDHFKIDKEELLKIITEGMGL